MTSEIETAMILVRGALCIVALCFIIRRWKTMYFEIRKKLEEARREDKRNN